MKRLLVEEADYKLFCEMQVEFNLSGAELFSKLLVGYTPKLVSDILKEAEADIKKINSEYDEFWNTEI